MVDTVVAKKYARSFFEVTESKEKGSESYQESFEALKDLYQIKESSEVLESYGMPRVT